MTSIVSPQCLGTWSSPSRVTRSSVPHSLQTRKTSRSSTSSGSGRGPGRAAAPKERRTDVPTRQMSAARARATPIRRGQGIPATVADGREPQDRPAEGRLPRGGPAVPQSDCQRERRRRSPKEAGVNAFAAVVGFFGQAAERLRLEEGLRQALSAPQREVRVQLRVPMDDGTMGVYPGYRVQHNAARGPYKNPGEPEFHQA